MKHLHPSCSYICCACANSPFLLVFQKFSACQNRNMDLKKKWFTWAFSPTNTSSGYTSFKFICASVIGCDSVAYHMLTFVYWMIGSLIFEWNEQWCPCNSFQNKLFYLILLNWQMYFLVFFIIKTSSTLYTDRSSLVLRWKHWCTW